MLFVHIKKTHFRNRHKYIDYKNLLLSGVHRQRRSVVVNRDLSSIDLHVVEHPCIIIMIVHWSVSFGQDKL